MLSQHTNERVNMNHHSATIIAHHLTGEANFPLTEKSGFYGLHHYDPNPAPSPLPGLPVLLAVEPLDLKVGVEVEDNALRGLWRRDDPVAVLVWGVLQRIARGGDITGLAGI